MRILCLTVALGAVACSSAPPSSSPTTTASAKPVAREGDELLGTRAHAWTVDHWMNSSALTLAELRGRVAHLSRFVVVASVALALSGCATSSTLSESRPLPAGVASTYRTLAVRMQVTLPEDEGGKYSAKFVQYFASKMADEKVFAQVVTDPSAPADLVLTLDFTRIQRPGGAMSVLASSSANAEVELDGVFTSGSAPAPVASLHVTGNSKNRARSKVGGFGVTSSDDYTETAIEEAADKLADLVASRR